MFFIYSESVGSKFNETEALDVLVSLAHRLGRKCEHGIDELDAIRNSLKTSFKNWYFANQEEQLSAQKKISECDMILKLSHDGIFLMEELIAVDENHFESWMNDVFHVFLEQLIPLLLENQTEYVVDVLDTFKLLMTEEYGWGTRDCYDLLKGYVFTLQQDILLFLQYIATIRNYKISPEYQSGANLDLRTIIRERPANEWNFLKEFDKGRENQIEMDKVIDLLRKYNREHTGT